MRGADWGADDLIVYGVNAPGGGLMQIPAAGGEPTPLFTPEDQRRSWYPQVLPEHDVVLFTLADAGAPDVGELHLLQRDTGAHRTLLPNAVAGRVLGTGHLVFVRSGALWAVPFDRAALDIAGTPAPVVEEVRVEVGGTVQYATADDGSLVYISGTAETRARMLVWVDRGGEEEVLTLPARDYQAVSLSPDGRRAAVIAGRAAGNTDVWVSELARGTLTRLTTQPGVETHPLWSPDGQRVVFVSTEDDRTTVYQQAADGSGTPERLLTDEVMDDFVPHDWSPDGDTLFLTAFSTETGLDIGMVSSDGSGTWEPLVETPANERSPVISPDGRWLAYDSDVSGRFEVYVQRLPEIRGRQQVSVRGAYRPRWSEDGRERSISALRQDHRLTLFGSPWRPQTVTRPRWTSVRRRSCSTGDTSPRIRPRGRGTSHRTGGSSRSRPEEQMTPGRDAPRSMSSWTGSRSSSASCRSRRACPSRLLASQGTDLRARASRRGESLRGRKVYNV